MPAIIVTPAPTAKASLPITAARPFRLGFGLIDGQSTASEFCAIECRDGFVRFSGIGHFDEGKTSRMPGVAIGYQTDPLYITMGLK